MQMADRDRHGVGSIVRRGRLIEREQHADHLLDLTLLGAAVAHDGPLDLGGRVFDQRNPRLDCSKHGHATRVTELERGARVDGVEDALDGDAVGAMRREQAPERKVDGVETLGEARVNAAKP